VFIDQGLSPDTRTDLAKVLDVAGTGDTVVVTHLRRLVVSLTDALEIASRLATQGVTLEVAGVRYSWEEDDGAAFLRCLDVLVDLQRQLHRAATIEGMAVARAAGRLRGRPPSLNAAQVREVRKRIDRGDSDIATEAKRLRVSRGIISRSLKRAKEKDGSA
jgi:DNA invertase Pin-like site-specific DNA recombinase